MYRDNQAFRTRVLANSATGRLLRKHLGDELFMRVLWNNASIEHGDHRGHASPPDWQHIGNLLISLNPDMILCFGQNAHRGFIEASKGQPRTVIHGGEILGRRRLVALYFPHPQARGLTNEYWARQADVIRRALKKC